MTVCFRRIMLTILGLSASHHLEKIDGASAREKKLIKSPFRRSGLIGKGFRLLLNVFTNIVCKFGMSAVQILAGLEQIVDWHR